jgi:hypothetical protein
MALLASAATARASDVTVRVFARGGDTPLSGAAVCLGPSANPAQFGADITGLNGTVVFSGIPATALVVTVSRAGHKGEQRALDARYTDRVVVMTLASGGGGPACLSPTGGPVGARSPGALDVTTFSINDGASVTAQRMVTLDNSASGEPNQYRASERADLAGAAWRPYDQKPAFELSRGNGEKVVYLQVRRYSRVEGGDLQTLSPIRHDAIRLQANP